MNFKDILETLPSIEHLTGLDVLNGETVIHHIPAAPGKLGSLRLYHALAEKFNGKLDRTSAQQGIEWFAEHVEDDAHQRQHRGEGGGLQQPDPQAAAV